MFGTDRVILAWGYDAALRDLPKWARGSNCGWSISGVCDFCGRLARGELIGLRGNGENWIAGVLWFEGFLVRSDFACFVILECLEWSGIN